MSRGRKSDLLAIGFHKYVLEHVDRTPRGQATQTV
jgi:hypothetical protein